MGIFKNDQTLIQNITLESLVEDYKAPWYRGDDYLEGALEAVIDTTANYNMIIESVMTNELGYLEEYKEDIVYTEASVEGFVLAIKKFLYKIWEKISSLCKSFMMFIDKQTKSDKAFLNKYKKEIFGKTLTDFEFDGYTFTIDDGKIKTAMELCNNMPDDTGNNTTSMKNFKNSQGHNIKDPAKSTADMEDKIEVLRANICKAISDKSKATKLGQSEFMKELFSAFRNGLEDKEPIGDKIEVGTIAQEMQTSADTRKKVNNLYRESKRIIDEASRTIEREQKSHMNKTTDDINKTGDDSIDKTKKGKDAHNLQMSRMSYLLGWTHRSKSLLIAINGAALAALKQRSKQNKALIIAIANYKYEPK